MIPHIVRESILTAENTRAIYSGTSQSVELLHNDKPVQTVPSAGVSPNLPAQTSAADAARAMIGTIAAPARAAQPPAANNPVAGAPPATAPAASNAPVNVNIVPPAAAQATGSTFQVTVLLSNARDLAEVPLQMHYDPRVLSLVNVDAGELMSRDGQAVALTHRDEGNGQVTISAIRPPHTKGVNGQGTLCTLTFKALAAGDSPLTLLKIGAKDSNENNLPTVGNQAVIHVK